MERQSGQKSIATINRWYIGVDDWSSITMINCRCWWSITDRHDRLLVSTPIATIDIGVNGLRCNSVVDDDVRDRPYPCPYCTRYGTGPGHMRRVKLVLVGRDREPVHVSSSLAACSLVVIPPPHSCHWRAHVRDVPCGLQYLCLPQSAVFRRATVYPTPRTPHWRTVRRSLQLYLA